MQTQVSGILFLSFQQACANLEFYLDDNTLDFLAGLTPDGWYPLEQYNELLAIVSGRYASPDVVLERVGEAMMQGWYHFGPGKEIINSSIDFLQHQTGSEGYHSLIKGPAEVVGDFKLTRLDEDRCLAQVSSTTPFSKDLERGVLQGGLALVGDLRMVQVDNSGASHVYNISYVPAHTLEINDSAVNEVNAFVEGPLPEGNLHLSAAAVKELGYRYRELAAQFQRQSHYWKTTNETLSAALVRNQQQQHELSLANDRLLAAKKRTDVLKNAIVDQAFNGIVTFNQDMQIIELNPSAERIFGLAAADISGKVPATDLLPQDVFAMLSDKQIRTMPLRTQIRQQSGNAIPVDVLARRVSLDEQTLCTAYIRDMTEMVDAEQQIERQREALHQSEKLTALGSLLSGVAHELNNPLSIVAGRAHMLEQDSNDPALTRPLQKIRQAADRCTRIVRTFLAMARQQKPERTSVNINQLIDDSVELLSYTLRTSGIDVERKLDTTLPGLEADATQLNQVITNLLINAQQALAEKGSDRRIIVRTWKTSSHTLHLSVEDNGPGVPQEIRHRIFEPFYTTKTGTGTGVGLSLSHGLISAHDGHLELKESELGGARFDITLPITTSGAEAEQSVAADESASPAARVLIVDDEEDFAEMVEDMLRSRGHQTTVAPGGHQALSILSQESFDVILSDVNMPELNGQEFYACLQRDFPEYLSKIAFVTGDTLGSNAQNFLSDGDKRHIEKPFTPADIRELVSGIVADA